MKPTRKMLISTGIVGIVLAGGASVAATASAGRLEQAPKVTEREVAPTPGQVTPATPGESAPTDLLDPLSGYDPDVVSGQVSVDPRETITYWTKERIEGAEPMPIPEVNGAADIVEPSPN